MNFEIHSQPTISEYYKTDEVYDTPKTESDYDNLEISQESPNYMYNSLTSFNLKKNNKIKLFPFNNKQQARINSMFNFSFYFGVFNHSWCHIGSSGVNWCFN